MYIYIYISSLVFLVLSKAKGEKNIIVEKLRRSILD